jgi:hypothetical protein
MKPGATTSAVASMMRAAFSGSCGATATILSPAIATSAFSRGVPEPSMTVPFLMSSDQDMGGAQTPPGRGPESASEKCACTTRQSPASLWNTMVERVMNLSPL